MNIPIEILWLFFALTAGLIAVGYLARFNIPISLFLFVAGGLLAVLFIMTENITLGNNISVITNIPQNVTTFENQTSTTYSYLQESRQGTDGLDEDTYAIAEFVDTSSDLIGDTINCIDLYLFRAGSPQGNSQIGILDDSNDFIMLFGQQDPEALTVSSTWYSYCLSNGLTYTIQEGNYIGIKYVQGNATNDIAVNHDSTNPFDGTNTVWSSFSEITGWTDNTGRDITARFYLQQNTTELTFEAETDNYTYTPNNYEFTQEVKVFMLLIASIICLIGGAIEIEQRRR